LLFLEFKEKGVRLVLKVHKAHKEKRAIEVKKDLKVHKVQKAKREIQAKALKATIAHLDNILAGHTMLVVKLVFIGLVQKEGKMDGFLFS
jgi:hypothetical protein